MIHDSCLCVTPFKATENVSFWANNDVLELFGNDAGVNNL